MIVFGKALKFINVQGINPPPELCSRKIICIIKKKKGLVRKYCLIFQNQFFSDSDFHFCIPLYQITGC